MNSNDLKGIAESLIDEFNYAAKESIRLYEDCLLYTSDAADE